MLALLGEVMSNIIFRLEIRLKSNLPDPPTHKTRASSVFTSRIKPWDSSWIDPDHLRLRLHVRQAPDMTFTSSCFAGWSFAEACPSASNCLRQIVAFLAASGGRALRPDDANAPDIFPGLFVRGVLIRKGLPPLIILLLSW
jgi:hypothetical protein